MRRCLFRYILHFAAMNAPVLLESAEDSPAAGLPAGKLAFSSLLGCFQLLQVAAFDAVSLGIFTCLPLPSEVFFSIAGQSHHFLKISRHVWPDDHTCKADVRLGLTGGGFEYTKPPPARRGRRTARRGFPTPVDPSGVEFA